MKVLVTGASGFLGRAVAASISAAGHEVRTFQRRSSGLSGVEDVYGSITTVADTPYAGLAYAVSGMDAVVHLAAKVSLTGDPADFEAVNVGGTGTVLGASQDAGVRRFVYVSSPSVAHSGTSIMGSDALPADPVHARGDYARTKARAELLALAADAPGFTVLAVRPHLVWGPGDTQLIDRIVDRARRGRLPLLGHGAALIDTTYVDNAASAIHAALDAAEHVHGQSYVITNGEPRPVAELLAGICGAANVAAPAWRVPAAAARVGGSVIEAIWRRRPGSGGPAEQPPMTRFLAEQLSTAHWFDQRRTRADLGWTPAISLDEGFRRLAAHYRALR